MADVLFVALIFAFFALAVLLVRACDSIIGPDPEPPAMIDDDEVAALVANEHELVTP